LNAFEILVRQLSPFQRAYIGGAAIVSVVVLVLFVNLAGQPNFQPAFTKLTAADAGAISEALRSAKITFQLADAGATILVPTSALADARVAASQAGVLPDQGAPGMELFDKSGFGMSEFDQRVTYQRAKEGELSRTLLSLEGVAEAKVTVVAAEAGLLSQDDQPATASVVIKMQDGGQPDRAMVRGIVSTVSSSIAGLSVDDVTVVDDRGRVLAGPQVAGNAEAMVAQDGVERAIAAKVLGLVDKAIGPGKASVAVSAKLDFTKLEQQIKTYTPITDGTWTPVSVHVNTETLGGASALGAAGIPGTSSNIPGLPSYTEPGAVASAAPAASLAPGASPAPGASATTATGYGSQDVTVNYNLSERIEKIVREPGLLERLSVSVLVDQEASAAIEPAALQAAIEAAIGADLERGDIVSVTAVAFPEAVADAPADPIASAVEILPGVLTTGLAIILTLILTVLLWRNMGALGRRADEAALLSEPPRRDALGSGYGGADARQGLLAAALPDNSAQAQIQERLRMVADEKPDALLGLMHGWLQEEGARR